MVCSKCGAEIRDNSAFCAQCGAATGPTPYPVPQPQYVPPPGLGQVYMPAAPKKKKTGLIAGIIIGIVMLLGAAAAVYFFVLAGTSVTGMWYSGENPMVLEFKDEGELVVHSIEGVQNTSYEYDKLKGEGTVKISGSKCDFTAEDDTLTVTADSGRVKYKRADKDFDADKFLSGCLEGLYSNKDNDEVIEFKPGKAAITHDLSGDTKGTYDYDFDRGRGTLSIGGKDYTFTASLSGIVFDKAGTYKKEAGGFDAAAFVTQNGNPLIGDWYDKAGTHGKFTFAADGTFTLVTYGKGYSGTYTFDKSTNTGTFTVQGATGKLTLLSGVLTVDGAEFTRGYADQKADPFEDIEGVWYSQSGGTVIEFRADGTAAYTSKGVVYDGTVSYNPFSMQGTIYIQSTGDSINFYISDDSMYDGYVWYSRDNAAQSDNPLVNTWYDKAGKLGVLAFYYDGTVAFYDAQDNATYDGTYTFDVTTGKGTLDITYSDTEEKTDFSLSSDGVLNFGNGAAYFTTAYVEQNK